jgi:peptidyl-prolyl cis-trans isomerase SurA
MLRRGDDCFRLAPDFRAVARRRARPTNLTDRSMDIAMKLVALLLALTTLVLAPPAARSQEMLRIAAVVNDEVISLLDVNARIRLLLLTLNQPESPATFRDMFPQVLRSLIDEKLELQEAKAKGVEIKESEVDSVVAEIEANNHMPSGGLLSYLEQHQVPKDTIIQQIRARLAWQRTVARRLRQTYQVTGDQIDEALEQVKQNRGKPEYLVAEIFLGIDNPEGEAEIAQNADRLVTDIKQGADFHAMARQFSEGATAAAGGDLGWVQLAQLDPKTAETIEHMQIGEVSAPIRTISGYHILWLRERRVNSAPAPAEARITLRRIQLPIGPNTPAAEIDAKKAQLAQATQPIKSCDDVAKIAAELHAPGSTDLGTLRVVDLAPALQSVVADLAIGHASAPVTLDTGLAVLVVCQRTDPGAEAALPSRDDIANRILADKLDGESRKYLRDLRQAAYIDLRG